MTASKLSAWLSGLLRPAQPAEGVAPGIPALEIGAAATAAAESALGSTIVPGSGASAVDAALGLALTGRRATAFVRGAELSSSLAALQRAAGRHAPLVVHAELALPPGAATSDVTAHDALHAVADAGAFVAVATSVQEAVDLAAVARRVAERALVPGLVAMDALETSRGLQDLLLPEASAFADFAGGASDAIETPTAAQRLLFGATRRRVPAWFSADAPLSLGEPLSHEEASAAAASHAIFFGASVAEAIAEACGAWQRRTGRDLSPWRRHRLDDARHVLVAMGSLVEAAEAAADAARAAGTKAGVLGVRWLRPFAAAELRELLKRAESVTVLERSSSGPGSAPPLAREIRAALAGGRWRVTHVIVPGPVRHGSLRAACSSTDKDGLRAGTLAEAARTSFPKRQAALQALRAAHPELDSGVLRPEGPAPPSGDARVLALCRRAAAPDDARLAEAGRAFAQAAGASVRARWTRAGADGLVARVVAAPAGARDPGDDLPADLVVVEGLEAAVAVEPPAFRSEATVAFASVASAGDLARRLPPSWAEALRARRARVLVVPDAASLDGAAMKSLLAGGPAPFATLDVASLPAAGGREPAVPASLRRVGAARASCDSLPRHHGEVVLPRLMGEIAPAIPEPRLAVAAAPSGAAAFAERGACREIPVIDAAACTGCGRCWTECPDSALGARALRTQALLASAAERSGLTTPQAGRIQRATKQLAAQVDDLLATRGARTLDEGTLREACDAFLPKLGLQGDDVAGARAALDAMIAGVTPALPLSVTPLLHARPNAAARGAGDLLLIAVEARSCQGCGACVAACDAQAVRMAPAAPELVAAHAARWTQWETLPDTTADSVARAASLPEIGPLAAALLSRDAFLVMPGGDASEPGSGERLAVRQLVAVAAQRSLASMTARAAQAEDLASRLQDALRATLAAGLPSDDLHALAGALGEQGPRRAPLADVLARIERAPSAPQLDAAQARRLATSALAVQELAARWTRGADGLGRAPFAVVASPGVGAWLAAFPGTSLRAPLVVAADESVGALARGLAEGLLDEAAAELRVIQKAELALEAPADISLREAALDRLAWRDLAAEAAAAAPPLLVVLRSSELGPVGRAGVQDLLASGLPVMVVLLDAPGGEGQDAALLAIARQDAFVLSSSVAHAAHLHAGAGRALGRGGPSLVVLRAPSPSRDGFPASDTVARAKASVASGEHALLAFDPGAPGAFGAGLELASPPEAVAAIDERTARRWSLLRQLAGLETAAAARVREATRAELETSHRAEIAALEAAHAERLAATELASREQAAAQLKSRLLELVARAPRAGVVGGGPA